MNKINNSPGNILEKCSTAYCSINTSRLSGDQGEAGPSQFRNERERRTTRRDGLSDDGSSRSIGQALIGSSASLGVDNGSARSLARNRREEAPSTRGGACPGIGSLPLTVNPFAHGGVRGTCNNASRYSLVVDERVTSVLLVLSLSLSLLRREEGPAVEGLSRRTASPSFGRVSRAFPSVFTTMNGNAKNERPNADDLDAASLGTDILNPFVHRLELGSTYEKLKTIFLTIALLPFRLAAITTLMILAWLLACFGLHGLSEEDLRRAPLQGWRRDMRVVICWMMRALFLCGGFHHLKVKGRKAETKDAPVLALAPHSSFFDALPVVYLGGPSIVAKGESSRLPFFGIPWICFVGRLTYQAGGMKIVVRGKQASRSEAPILVLAPHSTFIDGGIVYVTGFPSIIVRRESGLNPFIGKLINYTQPVYVWREDPNSRQNTIKEIIERTTSKEDWPQVMIFPEGTCTNRSCLITFKSGAFYPGVPVQPVCIRYPNKLDTVTWTWEGPGALKLLWLTLTQLNSSCEIEFLPVYNPSEAEKLDPKLYANNVRRLMAEALKIPVSDYTYDDCRIIRKAHQLHLPHASNIVKSHKLRYKLGLVASKTEEELIQKKTSNFGEVNLQEFAQILRLDDKDPTTQQLFRIHDKFGQGKVDLEEYIFTVLATANASSELDKVEIAFDICGSKTATCLTQSELRKALRLSIRMQPEESDRIFQHARNDENACTVTFDDVLTQLSNRTEYAHLFVASNENSKKAI